MKIRNQIIALLCVLSLASCSSGTESGDSAKSEDKKDSSAVAASETESKAENQDFTRGEKYFEAQDYENAIVEYKKVSVDAEEYSTAQQRIAEANKKFKESKISEADKLAGEKEFTSAMHILESAISKLDDNSELKAKLDEVTNSYKDYVLEESNKLILEDKLTDAINFIKTENTAIADNEEVKKKLDEYIDKFVSFITAKADEYVKAEDFDSAVNDLNYGLTILPGNEKFTNKITEIESRKPAPLTNFTITNNRLFNQITIDNGSVTDTLGNVYAPGNLFQIKNYSGRGPSYGEFSINKEYKTLSGTLAIDDRTKESLNSRFEIYADDKLIYYVDYNRKTAPIDFNVNVENVNWIKIQINTPKFEWHDSYSGVYISNVLLKK